MKTYHFISSICVCVHKNNLIGLSCTEDSAPSISHRLPNKNPNARHGTLLFDMLINYVPEAFIQCRLLPLMLVIYTDLMVRPITEDTTYFKHKKQGNQIFSKRKVSSLLNSFHSTECCYAGCWGERSSVFLPSCEPCEL